MSDSTLRLYIAILTNSLVKEMTYSELRVALVMIYHADEDGVVREFAEDMTRDLGMDRRNYERTCAKLASKRVVTTLSNNGGRGCAAMRRLLLLDRRAATDVVQ